MFRLKFATPNFLPVSDNIPVSRLQLTAKDFDAQFPDSALSDVKELSSADLYKQFGFEYTEDLVMTTAVKTQLENEISSLQELQESISEEALLPQLRRLMEHPRNDLEIAFISESVGYGVFATQKIEPLQVVAIYTGQVVDKRQQTGIRDYEMNYEGTANLAIDSEHIGGIARFIQHMPMNYDREFEFYLYYANLFYKKNNTELDPSRIQQLKTQYGEARKLHPEADLYQFNGNQNIENCVAYANLRTFLFIIDGIPIIALVSNRAINPHEMLGYSYTWEHWNTIGRTPELFTRFGKIIDKSFYQLKRNTISFRNDNFPGNKLLSPVTREVCIRHTTKKAFYTKMNGKLLPSSIYLMRDAAVVGALLPNSYAQLPKSSFALAIEEFKKSPKNNSLAKETSVELYWQKPEKVEEYNQAATKLARDQFPDSSFDVDIILRTDKSSYPALIGFFKGLSIKQECLRETNELRLPSVNTRESQQKMHAFIEQKLKI
ncbi:MAG: hypothetical protein JSS53_10275 [Proteobacteria bacterium]|nr:hypothetical protein [Pseudomonadota bacterium]